MRRTDCGVPGVIARGQRCVVAGWWVLLALPSAGCGDAARPEEIPNIDGSWTYSETVSLDQGRGSCTILGTLSLVQDFDTFVGSFLRTVSCAGSNTPPSTRSESGSIPRGLVGKSSIQFRIGQCDYRGTIAKLRPDRLTGTTLCSQLSVASASQGSSAGSWFADRLTDSSP